MERGLPERKGAKKCCWGKLTAREGMLALQCWGEPSKAGNRQEKGYRPLSFLILTPRLHLLLLPHVLVLPPDPLPLFSLYSLFTALRSQPPPPPCHSQHVSADTSPAASCFLPKGVLSSHDCGGVGGWGGSVGSVVPCFTRTSVLNALVLLRPMQQVRCGRKSRQVWAQRPATR